MHLQRIQVPDFRVLKDVDINFEKEFIPRIFPLGSLNGGGKSTLLQLIFLLLHCSIDPDRKEFLKNMINGFKIYKDSPRRVLAILDVWDGEKNIEIEFFCYKDSYIRELLIQEEKGDSNEYENLNFSVLESKINIANEIFNKETVASDIENIIKNIRRITRVTSYLGQDSSLNEEIVKLREFGFDFLKRRNSLGYSFEEIEQTVKQKIQSLEEELKQLHIEYNQVELESQIVLQYLQSKNMMYLFNYVTNESEFDKEVLLCQINNIDVAEAESFLKELSQKVFLAAPVTQVFIFISKEFRQSLFRDMSNDGNNSYYSKLQEAKSKLPGFFAYDFLPVDLIIEACKQARDIDFREAIETGEYGNNYQELMKELNLVLVNKKINLKIDFSGVMFQLDRDGEDIELQPEDLSHGELKRLSIYLWIKYHNMENAIVLMDEIEIAFHPDWQYQIISDLQQWAPSNQYILATHSYELCQALTPSHVKELEPRLIKKQEA
jgi:predicted ATP-binding protein involved in virulence